MKAGTTNRRSRLPRHGDAALAFLALAWLAACAPAPADRTAGSDGTAEPAGSPTAVGDITEADAAARVRFLASDLLAGRSTPGPGLEIAADYVASQFATAGLQPVPGRDGFLQWYDVETRGGTSRAPNAVAVLRGSDPELAQTWVVFTAHMDHVGVGSPDESGDSIYNGADDDASGTAALLEIAEAFALLPDRPARSVAFVAVSGEELGLLGSRAFLTDGGIPAARMVANINMDMIGRNAPDSVVAIGMPYSSLGTRLEEVVSNRPGLGLSVVDDPWPEEQFFFRSDHYNFAAEGIPAIFLFAGVHEDYHRPSDSAERIDAGKIARVATAAFLLGLEIARDPEPPRWTAAGRAALRRASR